MNITGTNLNGIHVPRVKLIFPDAKNVETVSYSWFVNFFCRKIAIFYGRFSLSSSGYFKKLKQPLSFVIHVIQSQCNRPQQRRTGAEGGGGEPYSQKY